MSRTWRFTLIALGLLTLLVLLTDSQPAQSPTNLVDFDEITAAPAAAVVIEATNPPPATVVAQTEGAIIHTVQNGETLYRIGQAYGVSTDSIIALNNLSDPSQIFVGQEITVPMTDTGEIAPTETPMPTAEVQTVAQAPPQQSPTHVPIATAVAMAVTQFNNLPLEAFIIMPPDVQQHIREIYARGQERGNQPNVFTKVGDSIIEHPHFMGRFDEANAYKLGDYAYLQSVIDYFRGSFGTPSMAVRRGLHSWSVMDPAWADKSYCQPNESVIACEFRRSQASVVFIKLGSNDVGLPDRFDENMREMVEFSINSGVIPVLETKADRHEGSDINNTIIRQVASDYHIPLWDFDRVAQTIPGKGLEVDGVHLTTYYAYDYTSATAFQRGHGVHNLTGLMVLDRIWRIVIGP